MDGLRVEFLLDQFTRWGYVEERNGHVQGTRKWNAKLQAAAEKLNLLAAKGDQPVGNPLVVAVTHALANENLDLAGADFDDAVHVFVTLELTRMGPTKRALAGFGDMPLADEPADDPGPGFRTS